MRVIAGIARGHTLESPSGAIRPTMDKVRSAIFSSLGDIVIGARVLDLFAGSGALGIEALSRGAQSACFVDYSPPAVHCIRKNLAKTGLEGRVVTLDAFRFLASVADTYDLIFADPPYRKQHGAPDPARALLESEELPARLASGGLLILEVMPSQLPIETTRLSLLKSRQYGETAVAFFQKNK